jgi:hypothetical protein
MKVFTKKVLSSSKLRTILDAACVAVSSGFEDKGILEADKTLRMMSHNLATRLAHACENIGSLTEFELSEACRTLLHTRMIATGLIYNSQLLLTEEGGERGMVLRMTTGSEGTLVRVKRLGGSEDGMFMLSPKELRSFKRMLKSCDGTSELPLTEIAASKSGMRLSLAKPANGRAGAAELTIETLRNGESMADGQKRATISGGEMQVLMAYARVVG